MAQDTYEDIENPYNSNLERSEGDLLSDVEPSIDSGKIETPSQIEENVIGAQQINDLQITNWIKSRNYQPKVSGFLLRGSDGYIEANKLFIGSGGIIGGSLDIPDDTTANSFHVDSSGNTWWGANVANFNTSNDNANAFVLNTGVAKFQTVTLSGSVKINDIITGSEISIQGWTHDMVFSVTDADTIAWSSGTITLMNADTYSIDSGNTGNMAAKTYVYLDIAVSITVLQTTTTKTTAIGSGKIMIAICENATNEAEFIVFGSSEANIDGANIRARSVTASEMTADTITANEIAANTITGTQISTMNLTSKTITADTGTIGGWVLGTDSLKDAAGVVGILSTVTGGDDIRFFAGDATPANAEFRVTESGALTATSATITGSITATSGDIGGWTITSGFIYNLQSGTPTSSPNDGLVLASGDEGIIVYENTEKRVEVGFLSTGVYGLKVYADDGSTVIFEASDTQILLSGVPITGIPNSAVTDISLLEATHDLVFSVTDADTIAWASGTVTLSNGRTFSIVSGNTGNMAALTYIYLDPGASTTVLQTTTTYSTAIGADKLLIGVAQNQTTTASYIPFTGGGKTLLDGEQLGALSVGSAVIGNLAVTNAKINDLSVTKLTAGTITSQSIVLAAAGGGDVEIRSGIAAGDFSNSGAAAGFILGVDDSDSDRAKFYFGDGTEFIEWNGVNLIISTPLNPYHSITAGENLTAGDWVKIINDGGTGKVNKIAGWQATTKAFDMNGTSGEVIRKAVKLDTDKLVILYSYKTSASGPNNQEHCVRVATASGTTLTFGSELIYNTDSTSNGPANGGVDIIEIDTDAFVVANSAATNTWGIVNAPCWGFTVSGTTITEQTSNDNLSFTVSDAENAESFTFRGLCKVSTDKFCIVVESDANGSSDELSVVATFDGSTFTEGTEFQVVGSIDATVRPYQLGTDRILYTYSTTGRTASVSSTTITNVLTDSLPASTDNHIFRFTSTGAGVIAYKNASNDLIIAELAESTGTLTFTNTTTVATSITDERDRKQTGFELITRVGVDDWWVTYDNKWVKVILTASDGFQVGTAYQVHSSTEMHCQLNSYKFCVFNLVETDDVNYTIGDVDFDDVFGAIRETVTSGSTAKVYTSGSINDNESSKVIGITYYMAGDGTLVLNTTSTINGQSITTKKLGIALSTSEILINIS